MTENEDATMAPGKEAFQDIVLKHVTNITDADFFGYTQHEKGAPLAGPSSDFYLADASHITRVTHVQNALSKSHQSPSEYFEAMIEIPHVIIGQAPQPVYFFSSMGVYAMGTENAVLEVWLSWPAYPKGWFKEPSGINAT